MAVTGSTSPRPWPGATAPAASPGCERKAGHDRGRGRAGRAERRPAAVALSRAPRRGAAVGGFANGFRGATGERLAAAGVLAALVGERRQGDRRQPPVRRARADARRRSRRAPVRRPGRRSATTARCISQPKASSGALAADGPCPGRPEEERDGRARSCCSTTARAAMRPKAPICRRLLDVLPIGLALVDRDGRFLTMNNAFRHGRRDQGQHHCRSIPATSWSRRTRPRSPTRSAATRAGRPCRATSRSVSSASRPSRWR